MKRPMTIRVWLAVCCSLAVLGGCACWDALDVRSQSPDGTESGRKGSRLVGDLAGPYGTSPVEVVAVGLVTGLGGTGGDPAPSTYRAAMIDEMQTRGVPNPNRVLASSDTALVLVRGLLRPGIGRQERFDVEVRVPGRSQTTSLRGGYLLQSRMRVMAVLGSRVREGHLLALAEGPVMVDPAADGKGDAVLRTRGRILGGGVALKSRPLGLRLKSGRQSVLNSSRVQQAINQRFHAFRNGVKVGVAKAKTDRYVELAVHPRYADNIERYMRVVRAVALRESATEQMGRIAELKDRLLDPVTAADAAVELEAIGKPGAETLKLAVEQRDREVRFYSAEALAYLDCREAAEPLGEAALREPAFRVFALTALGAMDDFAAFEQLRQLLSVPSAETRYGAFRALWAMNPDHSIVLGEMMDGQFSYHVLDTSGPPMIHVTRNRRPEIVLFGQHQKLTAPLAVNAGNQIMITSTGADELSVSKFSVEQADQRRVVSTRVDEVIRAVVELGGTYPDVVQALQEAKASGALPSRFTVESLPTAGRYFDRVAHSGEGDVQAGGAGSVSLPSIFQRGSRSPARSVDSAPESAKTGPDRANSPDRKHPIAGFFAKMAGRD